MQVGSADYVAEALSGIAADPRKRENFAAEMLNIMQKNEFDGVYVYW
jgi:GH18 family chitinase